MFDDRITPRCCSISLWAVIDIVKSLNCVQSNWTINNNNRLKKPTSSNIKWNYITFSSIVAGREKNSPRKCSIYSNCLYSIYICHLNHLTEIRQHFRLFRKYPICKPKFWRTSYKWMCASRNDDTKEKHVNRNLTCFLCFGRRMMMMIMQIMVLFRCFDVWWTSLNMKRLLTFDSSFGTLLLLSHGLVCAHSSQICDLNEVKFANWKCKTLLRN